MGDDQLRELFKKHAKPNGRLSVDTVRVLWAKHFKRESLDFGLVVNDVDAPPQGKDCDYSVEDCIKLFHIDPDA